ncbi:hypothetical protein L873DRAFT_1847006 [Choiromyces venosus 120613-1]|uniref:Uncharacterized protein n=1 Tax=Choiromyces venosus 120613-1 TaxID=1336337 RepID=A0A3N4J9Y5_9PEZI|nr:hypothetical protein L873DRAFT_1847006 [Choiromyces venosus 120613-1]
MKVGVKSSVDDGKRISQCEHLFPKPLNGAIIHAKNPSTRVAFAKTTADLDFPKSQNAGKNQAKLTSGKPQGQEAGRRYLPSSLRNLLGRPNCQFPYLRSPRTVGAYNTARIHNMHLQAPAGPKHLPHPSIRIGKYLVRKLDQGIAGKYCIEEYAKVLNE